MSVERFVSVSAERDTPLDVLAACREILPTAELVYVGSGRWWLGYMKETAAMDIGYAPPGGTRHQYDLQRQGFRWLGEYGDDFLTPSYLRKELEFMFGRTDADLNKDFDFAQKHSEGEFLEEKKRQTVRDRVEADARSVYAHVFRKRRGVLVP